MYIHQRKGWPNFFFNHNQISALLAEVRHAQGILLGRMEHLGFEFKQEANFNILSHDILKTSAIEGENLDLTQVRSSLAKRLGIQLPLFKSPNRHVDGIVEVLLDATQNHNKPLSKKRLCAWQAALFPTARSGLREILVGNWRSKSADPMQVVSGPYGKEKVHFEAPDSKRIALEMKQFITWFNAHNEIDLVLKSALAHFWFITLHPFEDGNGRIARALSDLMLARCEQSPHRFYSLSWQIEKEREDYYRALEQSQKGTLDITTWIQWFLECLKRAINNSQVVLQDVLLKTQFFGQNSAQKLNSRQQKVLNKLWEGFEGKLSSGKYAKFAKCSQDTALRDIQQLIEMKILKKEEGGGRSTAYVLEKTTPDFS